MKKVLLLNIILVAFYYVDKSPDKTKLNESAFLLSNKGSSIATAYIDSNKIVETEKNIFVTYLVHDEVREIDVVRNYDKIKRL